MEKILGPIVMSELPLEVQKQLDEIEKSIAETQARFKDLMSPDEIKQLVVKFEAKRDKLLAQYGGQQGKTAVLAQRFWQQYPDVDHPEIIQATTSYFDYINNRFSLLNFQGLGFANQLPGRLKLRNLYVPLKVRPFLPEGETWPRQFVTDIDNHEPVEILPLFDDESGLVILGDVGAGKTTFLQYIALSLVNGEDVHQTVNGRIPLAMPLSAYYDELENNNISLYDFFVTYFDNLGGSLPFGQLFKEVVARGKALILLDGLDEARDARLRNQAVQNIVDFIALNKGNGNKFLITSRLVGYRQARIFADGVLECTLADIDELLGGRFIERWLLFVEQQEADGEAINREKETLRKQIWGNVALSRLASNPLLLTIMLMMQRQGLSLPHRRVELYHQFINTLIKDWNLARNPRNMPNTAVSDVLETMRTLGPLALWMEEDNPGAGLVQREDFRRELVNVFRQRKAENPTVEANQFLDDIKQFSGILVEREDQNIAFLHRSLQEYLAAWAIAHKGQNSVEPVVEFIASHIIDKTWWELLRLSVGIIGIVQQREDTAGIILSRVMDSSFGEGGIGLTLVGEMLADIGQSGVTVEVYDRILRHLFKALQDENDVSADWRVGIGQVIGRMNKWNTIVDEIQFCYVPSSDFYLGEQKYEQLVTVLDTPYWLSQHLITHSQFFEFVEDDGYKNPEFWVEAATVYRWRSGEVMDWERLGWRKEPHDYGYPFHLPNHPIVGVSYYEALAFTRWLEKRWVARGFIEPHWQVRLPTEIQWEKAAKGGLQLPQFPVEADVHLLIPVYDAFFEPLFDNSMPKRPFPWGDEPPLNHANFRHPNNQHFDESSNFGLCFSKGKSPVGCMDMSGNVWEWTRSLLRPYPYNPDDGRETMDIQLFHTLALRGGAFWSLEEQIRTVSRIGRSPNTRSDSIGFRVCVMVPNPPR